MFTLIIKHVCKSMLVVGGRHDVLRLCKAIDFFTYLLKYFCVCVSCIFFPFLFPVLLGLNKLSASSHNASSIIGVVSISFN